MFERDATQQSARIDAHSHKLRMETHLAITGDDALANAFDDAA